MKPINSEEMDKSSAHKYTNISTQMESITNKRWYNTHTHAQVAKYKN